jgi:hypothetical protein
MTYPNFNVGETLRAADMNAVGLWLVKTQTVGAGVPSVTVTGAFSADYDAYLIRWSGGTCSSAPNMFLTLGATNTGYYYGGRFNNYGGTINGDITSGSNQAYFDSGYGTSNGVSANVELIDPFKTSRTFWKSTAIGSGTTSFINNYAGFLNDATSYTSFTFTLSGGTVTGGTIRVYGYKN